MFILLFINNFLFLTGDVFVARYHSSTNYVADNKREAGALFLNHLIDVGAVIMNGTMITTGPHLENYISDLDLGRWGNYNVHNARSNVERHLRSNDIRVQEYGVPGRYRCNLQYPKYGEGKNLF
jgi:hypothetical protein